jgi:flagellar basal-body rod protein FlgF/flagellar basal-body rod protein FlgG
MPYGLYISAEGAQAQSRRLEIIANNMANVDTVGFKRELAIFQARYAEAVEQGQAKPGSGSIDDTGGGIMLRRTVTDYSPGPMKRTESPTDVAISGEGFFLVEKDQQQYLTRAGNFRLTERGELVTQQGYAVLSDNGSPIAIDPRNGPCEVTPAGAVRQGAASQNLALVRPASPDSLVKVGENLFRPVGGDPQPVVAGQRRVASGYLELSGVRPTTELVQMIEASRAVEANLSMMRAQDQMLSGLVTRVMRA